jgi:N-acetylneuraminic acid mutarotase
LFLMLRHCLVGIAVAMLVNEAATASAARWQELVSMPEPRWFHTAGVGGDGKIYVYGGYVRTDRSPREHGLGEWSLVIFDPKSNTWTRGPVVPKLHTRVRQIAMHSVEGPDGRYVDEAYSWEHENEYALSSEVFSGEADPLGQIHWFRGMGSVFFNPMKSEWEQLPSAWVIADKPGWTFQDFKKGVSQTRLEGTFPAYARDFTSVATSPDGKVYLIGGLGRPLASEPTHPRKHELDLLAGVDVYDAVSNTWKTVAPMHHARQLHAATFGPDGKLYVFGGFAGVGMYMESPSAPDDSAKNAAEKQSWTSSLASVECYDPATDTWTEKAPMPQPRQAMGTALGADGRIYVVGGSQSFRGAVPLDTVDIYDPRTDTWSPGPKLHYARRGHAVVATPQGRIYAIGGTVIRSGSSSWLPNWVEKELGRDPRATVEVLDTKPSP